MSSNASTVTPDELVSIASSFVVGGVRIYRTSGVSEGQPWCRLLARDRAGSLMPASWSHERR